MRVALYAVVQIALILVWAMDGFAQQRPTIEERLIRLEVGQKALGQRIEDTNRRIDDLRVDMNQRFEDLRADMDRRFDDMLLWLQLMFGAVFATLGAVVAQWLTTARRVVRVETQMEEHLAETEKDRLLVFQGEKLEALEARLERLEMGRT